MLNAIRVFIKVVELGSFSKAGGILNMAPSSVARQIDNLEQELGVTLFQRSTRQLNLTEDGKSFLAGASQLLNDADNLKQSLKKTDLEPEGSLRISVFESFGRIHVCPILGEFLSLYPKVKMEFSLENKMIDLAAEEIDVAIRIGIPQDSNLKARKLLKNHSLICVAPSYAQRSGTPKAPDDLASHNCIAIGRQRQRNYWYFNKGQHKKKIAITGNLTAWAGTPVLKAALSGLGVAQLPVWMAAQHVEDGRLQTCLNDWQSSMYEQALGDVYAVYQNNSHIRPAIRVFIDFLAKRIATPASST